MIKAVIFDMDGLMFDTESAYSVVQEKMFATRGKVFTNKIKMPLMGKRAHEVMEIIREALGTGEKTEDLLKEQDKELIKLYQTSVEKLRGLDELIAFLNEKKIRKCIGTSSRRFLVDILLEKHGLRDEFEFVVSGDQAKEGKPNPEIYNLCVSRLGVSSAECLVLEDSLNGIKAGRAAGCFTCAIPSEFTKGEDFSGADIVCDSLADLKIKEFISATR